MSSYPDGNGNRNDLFLQYTGAPIQEAPPPVINHLLQQQQQQPIQTNTPIYANTSEGAFPVHQNANNPILWPNALIGTPFIQPATILQNQQQQHQQQQYNEYLYNLHMQQAYQIPPAPQQESYSVLPVGHGNFLKIYHCSDNGGSGDTLTNEVNQHNFPQIFRHPQQQNNNFNVNQQTSTQVQPQFFNNYELFSSSGTLLGSHEINVPLNSNPIPIVPASVPQPPSPSAPTTQSTTAETETFKATNLIINNLVNNWSPNLTGESYMQITNTNDGEKENVLPNSEECDLQKQESEAKEEEKISTIKPNKEPLVISSTAGASLKRTNLLTEKGKSSKTNNAPTEVKKRIIAEVKPMRMTYSDVLSKINGQEALHNANNGMSFPSNQSNKLQTANGYQNDKKSEKRSGSENDANVQKTSSKRSPTHEYKESQQSANANKMNKRSSSGQNSQQNASNATNKLKNPNQQNLKTGRKTNTSSINDVNNKKQNNSKNQDSNSDSNSSCSNTARQSSSTTNLTSDKDYNAYYNVTSKNNNETKANQNNNSSSSATNNANSRKANKAGSSTFYSNQANNSSSYGNHQSRSRYSNVSFSFTSKRSRGNNYSYGSSSSVASAATNHNYELAKKFLKTWGNYMLKALIWLYYLIYDIIVLSCSILYERLTNLCITGYDYSKEFYKDLRKNSNKPSIWIKTHWRRFDERFGKESKWAIWRRFYKKKAPDPVPENYKSGSLPRTGEEAMYSLLNCKGKDAYSILGVPPNCPQEQIRKHYKKIAVLVHPDKNKQAGAEEAFKVLQRAFELIGEPENRLAYDQSLVEALQAEKAWSELHVLLSQLQNKISEAANTIRCSTCALRHPRKVVERPHYAARQCGACKTRHSAREGDIWAETSLFGLRWKYLALMEGKVYDITEWANCQKGALAHLEANSHMVQYRIVRGGQQQQQEQQQQQQKQKDNTKRQSSTNAHKEFPTGRTPWEHGAHGKYKHDVPPGDASFQDFLDNLYGGQNPSQRHNSAYSGSSRRRSRRN